MVKTFSKSKLKDFAELARLAYHVNPDLFKETFKRIGIIVQDEDDVEALIKARTEDKDVQGIFKNPMGLSVKFNAEWIVRSIPVDVKDVLKRVNFTE